MGGEGDPDIPGPFLQRSGVTEPSAVVGAASGHVSATSSQAEDCLEAFLFNSSLQWCGAFKSLQSAHDCVDQEGGK